MTDEYTINAVAKYRQVYQGTEYTLTWRDTNDVEHKATSYNLNALQRFARNEFTKTGMKQSLANRIVVKIV